MLSRQMKSMISEETWGLYHTDPEKFKTVVREYFLLRYPGWTVTNAKYSQRLIYLEKSE